VSKRNDPHGWNSLDNYIQVHERRIADFIAEGFIINDGLVRDWPTPHTILIKGRNYCDHGLFLDVEKYLEVIDSGSGSKWVRTDTYGYLGGIEGDQDRAIFRYDNFHVYEREGHRDAHHRHRFEHDTWQEIEPPEWIGAERWPHLSDAIAELRGWWETIGRFLDLDTSHPNITQDPSNS